MPNIFKTLSSQHAEVEHLLLQLDVGPDQTTIDDTARVHLAEHLVIRESRHEAAEELVFWPAVRRRVAGGDALAKRGLGQERDGRFYLDALRFAESDADLRSLVDEYAKAARAHMGFEEQEVWPALRETTSRLGLAMLGAKLSMAMKLTPTRPHPHGADRPMGLLTKGTVAATVDRLRDRISGRAHA